jgi:ABC-2 type transport system permease protein
MQPRRTLAIALRQVYLVRGSVSRLLPMFGWVAVDIILWGFITRYLNTVASAGFNFVPVLLGAVLMWDFFTRVMQGVTMAFFEDVWSRNFLNIFASPLTVPEYLAGLVISSVATSTDGAPLALFVLVLFIFGIALGIVGCTLVLRLGPSAEWFVWPIPSLVSPFVGVFYPLATLPRWMQMVAHVLPPSYVFEGMRAIVMGGRTSLGSLAIGAGLAVLYVLGACVLFARVYRQAVRTGLIARYSAESVS